MRGTISGDDGLQHRVSRIWVTDDADVRHEVVRAWVGDSQGVPHIWFDKDVQLSLAVTPTVLDATQVRLSWVLGPQGEKADEYHVYRDGVLRTITTLTTYTDTGLAPGTTYTWRIDVVQAGSMTVSGTATATTSAYVPPPVVTLTATATGWDRVKVDWTVSGHDSFTLKRGSTTLATSGTTYTETGLNQSTAYTYTLTALKSGASSNTTVSKSATTPAHADLGLDAVAHATDYTKINLTWSAALPGIDEFHLARDGTTGISKGTATSHTDTGLAASTPYGYTLSAKRLGVVIKTDTDSATTKARPSSQKHVHLNATSSASYNGSNQNRGVAECYYGYYGTNQGQQKSLWCFSIPAAVRNCISIDRIDIAIYNIHSFNVAGGDTGLVIHHGAYQGGLPATFPGSTGILQHGGANWLVPTPRGAWMQQNPNIPNWLSNVHVLTAPGRYSMAEEFRTQGAHGFGLASPTSNQSQYGYAGGATSPGMYPQMQIWYTSWD